MIPGAAIDWIAPASGTYRLRVTFFEVVITGTLRVSRSELLAQQEEP
jgi:hypothetical protein